MVLTARIPPSLHALAKAKLFARRETFQDVISAAIERYVQPSNRGISEINTQDPEELIAVLHKELLQKKRDLSGVKALSWLRTYIQNIREILDKIDRVFGEAPGDPLAAIGIGTQKSDTSIGGNGSQRTSEREAGNSKRAHEVIQDSQRIDHSAKESLENAKRPAGDGRDYSGGKKHPRKKAG